jgi:hypothetical protein
VIVNCICLFLIFSVVYVMLYFLCLTLKLLMQVQRVVSRQLVRRWNTGYMQGMWKVRVMR